MNDERRNSEIAKHAAQEALAQLDNSNGWQQTVLAVIGLLGLGGTILIFWQEAQMDKKIEPLKTEIAIMKNDFSYIKSSVSQINEKLDGLILSRPQQQRASER